MNAAPVVAALFRYPVKSCRGLEVARAALDGFGFVGDRRWLVVDENGRFLTQRTTPRLALVGASEAGARLRLEAPGAEELEIAAVPDAAASREVVVWGDSVRARDLGDTAAAWLARVLGRPARLVAMGPDFERPVRRGGRPGDQVSFADGFPLLVISEASLAELNGRLDFPVPMNRFRPNIVAGRCRPGEEDAWRRIRIGGCVFRAAGPCGRCVVTTTDQDTLERSREPLRTLAAYRRGPDGEVFFGQNYIHESKSGEIAVGMPVEVLP